MMFPSTITRHNLSSLMTSITKVEASLQRTDLDTTKKIEKLETFPHQILGFAHSLRILREISIFSHESEDPKFQEVEKLIVRVAKQWDTKYENCRNLQLHEIECKIFQAIENKKPDQLHGLAIKLKSPLFNRLLKTQQKAQVQDLLQLISKNENKLRRHQLIKREYLELFPLLVSKSFKEAHSCFINCSQGTQKAIFTKMHKFSDSDDLPAALTEGNMALFYKTVYSLLFKQKTPLDEEPLGEELSWGEPFDRLSDTMSNILGYLSRAELSKCRIVSKGWQKSIDELFWRNIYIQLQDLANNPPDCFPWDLKAIVQQINSANYSAFKKVFLLDQEIKRKIGPGALLWSELIITGRHIEQIIQHCDQKQSSNLHRVWKAFRKHNKGPDLMTEEKISDWLNDPTNQEALNRTRLFDLTHLELTNLPKEIKNFKHLQKLDLSGNRLTDLPEWLGELENLKRLDLSGNQLTDLPEKLGELENLKRLDLSGNQFTDLPEALGELRHLKWLDLSRNQFTDLPEELGDYLEWLNLSGNQLTNLPEELEELQDLKRLNLSGNRLTCLPGGIKELENLEWLDLSGNRLTDLPEWLKELKKLKWLDLKQNPLTFIPPEVLAAFSQNNVIQFDK